RMSSISCMPARRMISIRHRTEELDLSRAALASVVSTVDLRSGSLLLLSYATARACPSLAAQHQAGAPVLRLQNADGHPKVAAKLAAEDLLQLSTPRPPGHVAHEHPLPSPRCPRPLPAAREVREHPKERDIHEYAAVVVVPEDDHAL